MKFAYADPPYLGCAKRLYGDPTYDDPKAHRQLIVRLQDEFPDGWAFSMHTPSIVTLAPFMPTDIRWAAWIKPFAVFKPNVNPAYAWEPVAFRGGRDYTREDATVRDWHSENITMRKGLPGAKPPRFALWIAELLGVDFAAGDAIDDLFPGTHGLTMIWKERQQQERTLDFERKSPEDI